MERQCFITIQEWMLELGLQGNELLAFALVYGFCQDGRSCFQGTNGYISKWLGTTERTTRRILNSLVAKGVLDRIEVVKNNVKFYNYTPGQNVPTPDKMSPPPPDKMSPHNALSLDKDKYKANNIHIYANFDFRSFFIKAGVPAEVVDQWLAVRKTKRLTNTKLAAENILNEIHKTDRTAEVCITEAVKNSWGGFKAAWMQPQLQEQSRKHETEFQKRMQEEAMNYVRKHYRNEN